MLAGVLAFLTVRFVVFVLMLISCLWVDRFVCSKIRRTSKHIRDIRVIFFAFFWWSALQGSSFLASVKLRFTFHTDPLTSRFGPIEEKPIPWSLQGWPC